MIFPFRTILRAGRTLALLSAPLVLVIVSAGLSRTLYLHSVEDIRREDQQLYQNPREMVVTSDGVVISRLPSERIEVDYPDAPATHQVLTELGRTRSGELYAAISAGRMYRSSDNGRTWTGWSSKLPGGEGLEAFCVLADDSLRAETRAHRHSRWRRWSERCCR